MELQIKRRMKELSMKIKTCKNRNKSTIMKRITVIFLMYMATQFSQKEGAERIINLLVFIPYILLFSTTIFSYLLKVAGLFIHKDPESI